VKQPAENVTLSAAEGEAMIARLSVSAPSRSDCERRIQVVRWYLWLVWTVQEAKRRLHKLRTLLCGRGPQLPTPSDPEAALLSAPSPGNGEATGASSSRNEDVGPSEDAGPPSGTVASRIDRSPGLWNGDRVAGERL
jgi:hypothetical protein